MPKKILIIILIVVAAIGGFFLLKGRSKAPEPNKKITEAVNLVQVSDRPYVTLSPASGKHPAGTEVEITIHNTTLGSTEADYELEYQAGSLLQGAFGSADFAIDPPPVSKTILLGTCSAGGKCDYNKDVVGGTLLLRLEGGEQTFAVKGEWTYQLMSEREGEFSSRDSKFRVDIGTSGLPSSAYVIVMETMGLPEEVEGEILAGPYHIAAASKPSFKSAELTVRLSEPTESAQLLGWTGSKWEEIDSDLAEKTLTAQIESFTTFVIVSSQLAE